MSRVGRASAAALSVGLCATLLAGAVGASPLRLSRSPVQVAPTAGSWGRAEEVPGTATLNLGGDAAVNAVSCTSAGNCAAGGVYEDIDHHLQAFVVDEVIGVWGTAEEVPGTALLNAGGDANVYSVSCTSGGYCAAGGIYDDVGDHLQAFVVDEVNGSWGRAIEAPRTGALNAGGDASLNSLSCTSDGNCAAGGSYEDGSSHLQAYFDNEVDGRWRNAGEVAGTGALNAGGDASLNSLSCTSAGNCAAAGSYEDGSSQDQAFVVDEVDGNWGRAEEVPGTATLNAGGSASVTSVSCPSAGDCAAVGAYEDGSNNQQAFAVEELDGSWGSAEEVPGTATLNAGGYASPNSVSCASSGNCTAGGYYKDGAGDTQAFVVDEVNGTWGSAEEVPGTTTLNGGGSAFVNSVSCTSAGDCGAGGGYSSMLLVDQAFVVDEVNGSSGSAEEVPGTATLNAGGSAEVDSVSCTDGYCAGGGVYVDSSGAFQAFVVGRTMAPTVTRLSPTKGPTQGGTIVTITGHNFLAPTAVRFGSRAARIHKVVSATEIQVVSPRGGGTVAVTVATAGGTSMMTAADQFSYVPRPAIRRVAPRKGAPAGGTIVRITGTNLLAPTAVRFGSRAARIHKVVSSTEIEVISPKGHGTVAVTVTTAGGTSAKKSADHFTY